MRRDPIGPTTEREGDEGEAGTAGGVGAGDGASLELAPQTLPGGREIVGSARSVVEQQIGLEQQSRNAEGQRLPTHPPVEDREPLRDRVVRDPDRNATNDVVDHLVPHEEAQRVGAHLVADEQPDDLVARNEVLAIDVVGPDHRGVGQRWHAVDDETARDDRLHRYERAFEIESVRRRRAAVAARRLAIGREERCQVPEGAGDGDREARRDDPPSPTVAARLWGGGGIHRSKLHANQELAPPA